MLSLLLEFTRVTPSQRFKLLVIGALGSHCLLSEHAYLVRPTLLCSDWLNEEAKNLRHQGCLWIRAV